MLLGDGPGSSDRIVNELWRRQKEEARRRKINEQREMREMLEKYWPWGKTESTKPRGLRNLRLDELFPNKDYQNAKRYVGPLEMGRPGGGAPLVNEGRKIATTKEDPLLRFQFGSKDLRRAVDNGLRYKTDRNAQMEYKRELDKLVDEKRRIREKEKQLEMEYEKRQGWSEGNAVRKLDRDEEQRNGRQRRVIKLEPIVHPKTFIVAGKNRKLSPFSSDGDGVELVALLTKDKNRPPRAPLCSTDVTRERESGKSGSWNRHDSAYLKDLAQQMMTKKQTSQDMKAEENETARRHFTTWTGFWGRPGNGAPRSAVKKASLDRLLYPPMMPIGVH
ncbi:uncharacterized protein LOC132702522 isoform X2 [Cylas formicarius]|uniref:uncharacterized protein LOC132702522 isoform X2 n=1 Tax=Cylas formicarius TaxID=197179 RepID=UPI002958A9C6|nr:uncharacterized protein LOC132702522 isoform X2 [Cylas formicarius]